MELTNIEKLAEWMGMPGDSPATGSMLTRALNVAEKLIFRICGRNVGATAQHGFVTGSKVQYLDGDMGDALVLAYTPVTAVASVVVVYGADSSGSETNTSTVPLGILQCDGYPLGGSAFNAEAGVLGYRNTGRDSVYGFEYGEPQAAYMPFSRPAFPDGAKQVKVTYTGGYTASLIPADLEQAALELAASYVQRSGIWKSRGGGTGEAFGRQVMEVEQGRVMELLGPFVRPGV